MRTTITAVGFLAVVAAGCAAGERTAAPEPGTPSPDADTAPGTDAVEATQDPVRETSEGCEDGRFHWEQPDCDPARSIDLDEIISGGPPPDGIPPIDEPQYEPIEAAATWLTPDSPVLVVEVDDDVRAYPLAILTWHEIVNDTIGGTPTVVTYCPLCNSALVFDRRVQGPDGQELLDFGTSGRLYRSNLVMYDRQHRNLWTQFEGEAVVGERFLGTRLDRIPAWLFGFQELSELHPDAQVLSRETGHRRDYGRNPYVAYDQEESDPFLFRGELDPRFPPMTRLVGLAVDEEEPVAILLDDLREQRVVEVVTGGDSIVVLWAPGQASALDTAEIDQGRDVGQTAAFVAAIDGQAVVLEPTGEDGRYLDARTGSTFDLRGRALDGPLEGEQLQAVPHDDTFWFVWVAFRPGTEVLAP